jgi:hypothetical protein
MFNLPPRLLQWLCELVERNQGTPMEVYRAVRAYTDAQKEADQLGGILHPTPDAIKAIARKVHHLNRDGYRTNPLKIGGGKIIPHADFDQELNALCDDYLNGTYCHDEWYYWFQELHPFLDGNGRTGAIVWRLMTIRGCCDYDHPPRFTDLQARFG